MGKNKTKGPRYDAEGARLMMRGRDFAADMGGQFALGIMANIVGQLTYFYTDKVGVAVGGIGIVLLISKILDAFTDVIVGNMVDHSKGGNRKYYSWMIRLTPAAALVMIAMFTVPRFGGNALQLGYILLTNILLSAIVYTMIATPFAAVMVVRTNSNRERGKIGVFRAIGNYGAGMFIAIAIIPITNALGGTQSAWIKFGVIMALVCALLFVICYRNGVKTKFASDITDENETAPAAEEEEENVPFKEAMVMLLKNKYWVIVLLFNAITAVSTAVASSSGAYYCKWIFGDDNLVAIIGAVGMLATLVGFAVAQPMINKFGIKKTVYFGLLGMAVTSAVRIFVPDNFVCYVTTSLLGSFAQIPLMCLYGVLTAMTVDYNEWKYGKKLIAISGGAVSFGNKVGNGLGAAVLTLFLTLGSYDGTLSVATDSMKASIYGFSNWLPVVMNLALFFVFTRFDLEEKLPKMREEVAARKAAQQ